MKLKIKLINWNAGLPVAMLNDKTAEKLGVRIRDRISIKIDSKEIDTIVDTIGTLIKEDEIAVSSEIKKRLNLRKGQKIDVNLAMNPDSLNYIKKKLNNKILSKKEIEEIISDIVSNSLSEAEIALFVSGMYKFGMTMKETIYLIDSIVDNGNSIDFKNKFVADKHSIGGIAGNRTTPILVSICAAAGLILPKNSSRAITSAAGTADVIETIANIEFSIKDLKKIIRKTGACMVWGGSLNLVPADSMIIQVEKMLNLDPESQLLASIMSKKIAVGSDYILIDIPYGKNAKVDKERAMRLKRKFEYLGRHYKKKMKVVLTDGSQPIGSGIGPSLELMDVLKVLRRENGPRDLEEKSLFLSGELLELTGKAKKGQGIKIAKCILDSGKALKKFEEIIKAQGGSLKKIRYGKYKQDILAKKSGTVYEIHNKKINLLARTAGCPADKYSGLYIHVYLNQEIKKGEKLITIYAESKSRLKEALRFFEKEKPVKVR
jgi:AMP phosphorylase